MIQIIDSNKFLNEILEKELVKPVEYNHNVYCCPTCEMYVENGKGIYFYCPYCGQHLSWGLVKNRSKNVVE